jgi:hypothetical protein
MYDVLTHVLHISLFYLVLCPAGAAIPSVTSPRRSSYGAAGTVGVSMTDGTNKSSVSSIIGNGVAAGPRVVRNDINFNTVSKSDDSLTFVVHTTCCNMLILPSLFGTFLFYV